MKKEAIWALYPQVTLIRGDEAFDATGNPVAYDEAAVQAYVDAHAYIAQRQAEYPSIGDQLDALFHAGVFPAEMAAMIQAVKDKYPKTV
jgi:hypothetical protein